MKKASVLKRQRRMSRGTTLIYHSDTKHKDDGKRKTPVRMIGQGRNRGTTLHYTHMS